MSPNPIHQDTGNKSTFTTLNSFCELCVPQDLEDKVIRKMRLKKALLSLVQVSYKSGPVWKTDTSIRLLLSDEETAL